MYFVGVLQIIIHDPLIQIFAKHQLLRKGDQESYTETNQIRQKLRFLARLLVKLRDISGRDLTLNEFACPKFYDAFVEAVLELRQENKQLAVTLGYYVKKLVVLKKAEGIKCGDAIMRDDASEFLDLYNSSWGETVMSSTIRMQQQEKVNKAILLPDSQDLQLIHKFVDEEIEKEAKGPTDYVRLQKLLLSALVLFNKRRPAEVSSITISDYRISQAGKDDREDITKHLSVEERAISGR